VKHAGDLLGLPVGEDGVEVPLAFGGALDEPRRIADRVLLGVDRGDVVVHDLGADL
jgi:hypothetical protein